MAIDLNAYPGHNAITRVASETVALPVIWGNGKRFTQEVGIELLATGLTADAQGNIYLRPGTVVVRNGASWVKPADAAAITAADAVAILKPSINIKSGKAFVGIFIEGGFYHSRMPSLANNAVMGLETAAVTALKARNQFLFAEDYNP